MRGLRGSAAPVLTEDRVIQDDLFQQLYELVGQVSGHEGLDSDRHLLRVLGLGQSSLYHLAIRVNMNISVSFLLCVFCFFGPVTCLIESVFGKQPNLVDELSPVGTALLQNGGP